MILTVGLILFIASALLAAKVPGCDENNNNGVFKEFGPLPAALYDSNYYYQVIKVGNPYRMFTANTNLKDYIFENVEFQEERGVGTSSLSYYKIMFKDKAQYRVIDYVRVDPKRFDKLEGAILEADEAPSGDRKIKIKFLLSDCTCVMRTYDLNTNDVVDEATSTACDGQLKAIAYPHNIRHTMSISLKSPTKMAADDVFPQCDPNDNLGVMYEFGPLPSALRDPNLYKPAQSPGGAGETITLSGHLVRYKVEFNEYLSVFGAGSEVYGYLTLYFWDQTKSSYKVLDYLRVQVGKWKLVHQAIVYGNYKEDSDGVVRLKFFTSDCKCVQRLYDLDSVDTAAEASTSACNGDPIQTPPHMVAQKPATGVVSAFGLQDLYPGCVAGDNFGVLDIFGPLPPDLIYARTYYEVENTGYFNRKFKLFAPLDHYVVSYSEYRDQPIGHKIYSYLTLYYLEDDTPKLMDYLRVHPRKWDNIKFAILESDVTPDSSGKLSVKYLTADCTCKMRVYDLDSLDIVDTAVTKSCDGQTTVPAPARATVVQEQANLKADNKANYELWSIKTEGKMF